MRLVAVSLLIAVWPNAVTVIADLLSPSAVNVVAQLVEPVTEALRLTTPQ